MKFIFSNRTTRYVFSLIDMETASGSGRECVFICEHEGVYSAGKSFEEADFLSATGMPIYYTNRGGRVTIHNPGQIVVYPIISLRSRSLNVSQYVALLEQWIIDVLSDFRIRGERSSDGIGVWASGCKIGFLGIRIERGVSTHGLCVNVNNDLSVFKNIVPCGLRDASITSMSKILGRTLQISRVAESFMRNSPFL